MEPLYVTQPATVSEQSELISNDFGKRIQQQWFTSCVYYYVKFNSNCIQRSTCIKRSFCFSQRMIPFNIGLVVYLTTIFLFTVFGSRVINEHEFVSLSPLLVPIIWFFPFLLVTVFYPCTSKTKKAAYSLYTKRQS